MAKIKNIDKEELNVVTPQAQALAYLKENKDNHYNFEEDNYYKVPSSSLNLNLELSGGLPPGAHRFIGITAGGKTSCSLDFMFNFLKMNKNNRAVYFKSEGRLSPEIQERSGVKFTLDPNNWDNNCLIVESNIYETIFGFIRTLIVDNPTKTKYFFIIDSVDNMVKFDDLHKPLEEAQSVAGGALISSVFLKKTALALSKRGHILIFISQVRDEIKINVYQKTTPRQGKSSGGHALEHAANVVADFLPRFNDDIIRENPNDKNSKVLGHKCKIKIVKSDNENYNEVNYPVKYGQKGGNSVWKELEIFDQMICWNFLKREGQGSFILNDSIFKELKTIDENCPDKFRTATKFQEYLVENPKITEYLFNKFKDTLSV